jgi:hypothetical protein
MGIDLQFLRARKWRWCRVGISASPGKIPPGRGVPNVRENVGLFDVLVSVLAAELLVGFPEGTSLLGKPIVLAKREKDSHRPSPPGQMDGRPLLRLLDDMGEFLSASAMEYCLDMAAHSQMDISMYIIRFQSRSGK